MSITSKSPKAVLLTALKIARASLPAHSHKNSPKKFTQHQLFACLVLKNFLRTDYRGLVESLADCDSLSQAIELESVPHFTTFQKAAKRLLVSKDRTTEPRNELNGVCPSNRVHRQSKFYRRAQERFYRQALDTASFVPLLFVCRAVVLPILRAD